MLNNFLDLNKTIHLDVTLSGKKIIYIYMCVCVKTLSLSVPLKGQPLKEAFY